MALIHTTSFKEGVYWMRISLLNIMYKKAVSMLSIIVILGASLISATDANAFDSQKQYENYVTDQSGISYLNDADSCTTLKKFINIFGLNDLYNVVMPTYIDQDHDINATDKAIITAEIIAPAAAYAAAYVVPGAQVLLLGAVAANVMILLDICTNVYIMQPNEYANYLMGGGDYVKAGQDSNGTWYNAAPCAATAFDIQYYFQCNNSTQAGYSRTMCDAYVNCDPVSGACTSNGVVNTVCNSSSTPPIRPDPYYYSTQTNAFNGKVGSIVFARDGGNTFISRLSNGRKRFSPGKIYSVNPGGGAASRSIFVMESPVYLTSYYRVNQSSGTVEACLISPLTIIPVLIGCAPVAPPLERPVMAPTFAQRCVYIMKPRSDLNSLGTAVINNTLSGGSASYAIPIARFLKSDMHFTSTMVGCVQDMVVSVLTQDISGQLSFLELVQARMRSFVFATLCLYVALVGIKIMLSEGGLKRSDYIMFLVKFAMVLYLNTGAFWATTDQYGGKGLGVFQALIDGQGELESMFVSSLTDNDPLSQCAYLYNNKQLLTDQTITNSGNVLATNGYAGVRLSVWDMLDCKMANYLNLGSCHYEGQGMLISMIVGLCALMPAAALIFIFFAYFTISTVFKFARISILVAIVMSTLVIVSPIFACFMLFDKTMPMFKAWVKSLIGTMLYPAFLMAYFSLMVLTIDTVYYGDINIAGALQTLSPNGESITRKQLLEQACKDSKSVYCATVSRMGDPCANDVSNYSSQYSSQTTVLGSTSATNVIKDVVLSKYLIPMIRVLLFSLLFYFLMDASIGFIGALAGAEEVASVGSSGILSSLMSMFFNKIIAMATSKGGGGKK